VRVRGEYRFSSLLKQNKKAKICFVIYIAGFFFLKFLCYEVFAKQKKTERCRLYYYPWPCRPSLSEFRKSENHPAYEPHSGACGR